MYRKFPWLTKSSLLCFTEHLHSMQLVPYFVLDQMSYLTGLPGLFVACIMSGALSTVSSGLNAMAAVTWQDFVGNIPVFKRMSEGRQSWVLRAISKKNIYSDKTNILYRVSQNYPRM